jgi:hypothetical protein
VEHRFDRLDDVAAQRPVGLDRVLVEGLSEGGGVDVPETRDVEVGDGGRRRGRRDRLAERRFVPRERLHLGSRREFLIAEALGLDVVRENGERLAVVAGRGVADRCRLRDSVVPARQPGEAVRPGEPGHLGVVFRKPR